jgi:CheY-like chemotaxis protein
LLVEDQASDAELAVNALRGLGLDREVTRVCNGAEALDFLFARGAYADRNPEDLPRLILLDLKLPKIDGLQVLEAVRSDEHTKTVPVVVLSSSKEAVDVDRCYERGVNSYVVKPVDFDRFTDAVQQIGRYWLSTNETG